MEKYNLTEGVIWKKLLIFFFPILGGMLFQQLYNTVDAVIVGRCVGSDALAAVGGSSAVIINLVIGIFTGLASGATVIISQYFGAKNDEKLSKTVHTAIAFCLAVGAALTVICYFAAPWAIREMRTPLEISDASTEYLRIYFSGTVALLIFNVGSGILRAVGDSRRPLYFLVVCCGINIALDLAFVKYLNMGVPGAAWATVISVAISAVLVIICLLKDKGAYRLEIRKIGFDSGVLAETLHIGIPAGIQSAMYSVSNLIIQTAINRLGTTVMAAWTAIEKFDGIYWVTSNAFGIAICAFVGQCFGAGLYDRLKKSVRICLGMAIGTSAAMSIILMSLSRVGMTLINDNPEVIDYGVEMLGYFVPFYVVWSFIEVLSSTLRGVGDSVRPMIIVIVGVCVLRVLWVIFVVPNWNTVMGISMSYPFTWTITALAMLIYYRRSNWLDRCRSFQQ